MEEDTLLGKSLDDAASARTDLRVGDVLGGTYRIESLLAAGGAGSVFVATHERLPGRVAVKTLRGERLRDATSLARFRAEARITAELRHPNIVQVLDFDVTPAGLPFLVMELLEGKDLRALIAAGPCPLPRVVSILAQLSDALALAHMRGVVHRDLKPANVVLLEGSARPDLVKIVDFGLSKLLAAQGPPLTRPDQVLGTPGYMAPEQIRGQPVDARVDQFALASLSYELLSGYAPFQARDLPTLLHAVVNEEPAPLADRVPWPAESLSRVIGRALAKHPDQRYPDIAEFTQRLTAAIAADTAEAVQPRPDDLEPGMLEIGQRYRW